MKHGYPNKFICELTSVKDNGVEIYAGVDDIPTVIEPSQCIVCTSNRLSCDGTMVAYSIAGKPMVQGATIDLAALPRGIYIVRATLCNGRVQTMKVVR